MVTVATEVKVVTYHCAGCGVPVARMRGGILTILSTHHGDRHETDLRIPMVDSKTPLRIT